jgi:hypothetical protein
VDEKQKDEPKESKPQKVYPSYRYHPDYEPLLVVSEEHEKSLGKGWVDSPAKFPGAVEEKPGDLPVAEQDPLKPVRRKSAKT